MLRRFLTTVVGVSLFTGTALAQNASSTPQQGLYVGGAVGQSTFWDVEDVEFDLLAFMFSGIVGYRMSPSLRAEGELLYESADFDDFAGDLEVLRVLGSVYFDLAPFDMAGMQGVRPYLGGGGGLANVDGGGDDENELTLHGEVGLSAPIAPRLELVPGIRHSYTTLDGGGDDLWVTQLRVGIRYSF